MTDTTDHPPMEELTYRVRWLEHESLTRYQLFLVLVIQTVFPACGAFALISSAALWVLAGPSQALANIEIFVHIAVALVMGISLIGWVVVTVTKVVARWRDSPIPEQ
jgi:hypothetical protein